MCVVSFVGDHFSQKWSPYVSPKPTDQPFTVTNVTVVVPKEEFDQLKKDVAEMKELLIKAKLYDKENKQPDCELEAKIAILRKVAEAVGISLDDIFEKKDKS